MSDPLIDLKNKWDDAKKTSSPSPIDSKSLIAESQKNLQSAVGMHVKNIAVLLVTLIVIACFFKFAAPLQETLSHVGIALMLGGIALRIVIELYSIHRSSKIDMSASAKQTNESTLNFYSYRKRIHGPVTISILIAYTIGFYGLTPEFSEYFTTTQVILMDVSYLGAAAIFLYSIRRAVKDEMKLLTEMRDLQNQLLEQQ